MTSKLKKVDPSQMTHKNPELRAGSVVAGKGELGLGPFVAAPLKASS